MALPKHRSVRCVSAMNHTAGEPGSGLAGGHRSTHSSARLVPSRGIVGHGLRSSLCPHFADWGVIVLDASDAELARVAQPMYRAAVERAGRTRRRSSRAWRMLEGAGYHQQVKVTESSVLLFTTRQGARTPISVAAMARLGIRHRRRIRGREAFAVRIAGRNRRES